MKQILISIKPEWVMTILNGEKTVEVRKTAPKEWVDYLNGKTDKKPEPMTVFIYCTKPNAQYVLSLFVKKARGIIGRVVEFIYRERVDNPGTRWSICNGKVVAKFTLSEIVPIVAQRAANDVFMGYGYCKKRDFKWYHQIEEQVCLGEYGLTKYLNNGNIHVSFKNNQKPKNGYAWHISDLEIFDEPKILSTLGFSFVKSAKSCAVCPYKGYAFFSPCGDDDYCKKLVGRAPQSWCYVEEKE